VVSIEAFMTVVKLSSELAIAWADVRDAYYRLARDDDIFDETAWKNSNSDAIYETGIARFNIFDRTFTIVDKKKYMLFVLRYS